MSCIPFCIKQSRVFDRNHIRLGQDVNEIKQNRKVLASDDGVEDEDEDGMISDDKKCHEPCREISFAKPPGQV